MSVLMEFSIFPLDRGDSVSREVSLVIEMIRNRNIDYQLTAMGTLIETDTVNTALAVVQQATELLHNAGCRRLYSTIKLDIREGQEKRLIGKLNSIKTHIGEVNT